MESINNFIKELDYYRAVVKTQTDPEILKAELSDLIAEANDFVESLRPLNKAVEDRQVDDCGCKDFLELFGVHRPGCVYAFDPPAT